MSSINSLNHIQSIAISSYKGEELSTTTKMRLEALGIDPSTVQSEAQAQILIAQAEAAQKQNNSGHQQGGNSSEQELMSEAKTLAQKVGADVSSQDKLEDITSKISEKIQVMANDPSQQKRAQQYQAELTSILQRAENLTITQQNIFNTLNMISVSNKLILGL